MLWREHVSEYIHYLYISVILWSDLTSNSLLKNFQEKVYGGLTYRAKLKKERGNDPLNKLTSTDK